jgi:hypothetical protein
MLTPEQGKAAVTEAEPDPRLSQSSQTMIARLPAGVSRRAGFIMFPDCRCRLGHLEWPSGCQAAETVPSGCSIAEAVSSSCQTAEAVSSGCSIAEAVSSSCQAAEAVSSRDLQVLRYV